MSRFALKRLFTAAAILVVISSSAFAQRMGSSNRFAATVGQTIAFGDKTIELSYTAITWGGGQWAAQLADEGARAGMRDAINKSAEKTPLGTLKLSTGIAIGETKVAAGTYKVAFTIDEKFTWQVSLIGEAATVTLPLTLKTVEDDQKRLALGIRAGEKDFTAELLIAFGKSRCVLPVTLEK